MFNLPTKILLHSLLVQGTPWEQIFRFSITFFLFPYYNNIIGMYFIPVTLYCLGTIVSVFHDEMRSNTVVIALILFDKYD